MKSKLAIFVALFGWTLFILCIFYDYDGRSINILKHFKTSDLSEIILHSLMLSAPIGLTVTAYLMNEKKKLLVKTQQSEEIYRSFVQNFQGIAFHGNMDFAPIFFRGHVERITGYTEKEFTNGKPRWDQVIHPDDLSKLKESIEKISSVPDCSIEREYRIMHKNGQIRWVYESIANICDNSGKPIYVQGVIHDITERKKMEEEVKKKIREHEKFYEVAVSRELRIKELKNKIEQLESEKNNS